MKDILKINQIHNIDCLEGLKLLDNESVDLVFFDPPFNLDKDYGKGLSDKLKKEEYLSWQYNLLDEAKRILKPTGSLIYHNIPKWTFKVANYLDEIDLVFHNWIVWSEGGSLPAPSRLYPKHYPIIWFSKTKKKTMNKQYTSVERCRKCNETIKDYGGKYKDLKEIDGDKVTVLSDVWMDIHRIRHNKNKTRAANELPTDLMNRIISTFSNEGDLIVDPFMGSGTTGLTAKNLGRSYIGFELNVENVDVANERIKG